MSVPPDFRLSYESVVLTADDVTILEHTGCWFNDKLLTFCAEFLEQHNSAAAEIQIFTPPQTEMIRHSTCDEEVDMYFGCLDVNSKDLIAFIVNDNQDVTRVNGGSHWSLLIFDRKIDKFRHFDSARGHNLKIAENLMQKSRKLVRQRQSQRNLEPELCLQQKNASDCGLHVAQYLAVLAEQKSADAIGKLEKIDKTRGFWRDLIVNFEAK